MLKFDSTGILIALGKADISLPSDSISIADRSYAAIKRDFLEGAFSESLRKWIWELGIRYQQDCEDCDDFTRFAASVAQLWNAKTADNGGNALAFGEFWFTQDSGDGHAVNIVLVEGGEVVFYEPQTQRIIELSDTEKSRPSLIRF